MNASIGIMGSAYGRKGFQNFLAVFETAKAATVVGDILLGDRYTTAECQ